MRIIITGFLIGSIITLIVLFAAMREEIRAINSRISAQEDAISRVAGKQFEDSKQIAGLADRAEKLSQRVTNNSRELDKLKRFTYRLSTHPEDMTDGFQGK